MNNQRGPPTLKSEVAVVSAPPTSRFFKCESMVRSSVGPELLLLPNLSELLQVRRPKRVSDQIAQAVYQHHFAKHEETGDTASAFATYQSVDHRYQKLVRSTEGLQSPDALKFALVSAVASDPPRRNLAEQISNHAVLADDAAWASALLATLPAAQSAEVVTEAVTGYDVADVRYNENNFDDALALYLDQPHTAQIGLPCSRNRSGG